MLEKLIQQEIARFAELETKIRLINNYANTKDLLRIARSCENTINDISKEQVTCRRIRRETQNLTDLYTRLCEFNTTLEQYLTLAMLVDD